MEFEACLFRVGIEQKQDIGHFSSWKSDADNWEWIPFKGSGYHKYDQLEGRSGKTISNYLPEDLRTSSCHYDPDLASNPCTYGEKPGWGRRKKVEANRKIMYALKMPKYTLIGFYAPFWNPNIIKRQTFPEKIKKEDFHSLSTEIFGFIETEKIILISNSDDIQASRFGVNADLFAKRQVEGFLEVFDASVQPSLFAMYPNEHLEPIYFRGGTGHLIIVGTSNSWYLSRLIQIGERRPFTNKAGAKQHRDYLLDEMADLLKMERGLDLTQSGSPRKVGDPVAFKSLLEQNS